MYLLTRALRLDISLLYFRKEDKEDNYAARKGKRKTQEENKCGTQYNPLSRRFKNKFYSPWLTNTFTREMSKSLLDMLFGANIYSDYCPISQYRNLKVKPEKFPREQKLKNQNTYLSIKPRHILLVYHRYKRRIPLKALEKGNFRGCIILFKYSNVVLLQKT